jgi:hypothetical protein
MSFIKRLPRARFIQKKMFSLNFTSLRMAALGMLLALLVSCTKTSQPGGTDAPQPHILTVGMEMAYPRPRGVSPRAGDH